MTRRQVLITLFCNLVVAVSQQVDVWTTNSRSEDPRDHLRLTRRLLFQTDKTTGEYIVDVNEHTTYQTVDGFGVTLSDSSAWLIWNKMSALKREHLLRSLFDRRLGIGLNVIRISIGASEFSTSNYTYDDTCCDLSDFTIDHDKEYIIPILKTIRRWNPDVIIIGILWSPPSWMKVNKSIVGGKLRRAEQSNFATYLTKFVQAYRKEGLTIHSLVIQNEPVQKSCCYPSMSMDAREQAYIIKTKLGPVFRKYKIPTRLLTYGQDWEQVQYPLDILEDEQAKPYVSGTAFTCYGGTSAQQKLIFAAHPEQDIWLMECSDSLANGAKFEHLFTNSLTQDIVQPLRNYGRGVLKGNLVLNQNHGPVNEGCKDCLGMITLDEDTGNLTYNAAYYSFGHASKFVRSGARRIQSSTFTNNLNTIAFLNQDGSKVLIVNNRKDVPHVFKVQWGNLSFSYTLDQSSAATFVWKGTQSRKPAYEKIEAESFSDQRGIELQACSDSSGCGDNIAQAESGDYLKYNSVDFGDSGISSLAVRYASESTKTGLLELRLDALDGKFMGLVQLKPTGGWQTWVTVTGKVRTVTGVRDLYLVFRGGDPTVGNINWFVFNRKNVEPTNVVVNENAVYKITAMQSDNSLQVPNGETTVFSGLKPERFTNDDHQKFLFRSLDNSCYKIGVKSSFGLVLGYASGYNDTGREVVVESPERNLPEQRWRMEATDDGYVRVVSCTTGKVWSWNNTVQGSQVHLDSINQYKEQRFSVVQLQVYSSAQEASEKYWRRRN